MGSRNRKIYSIKDELIKKSQESALAAIQIFNNPLITFKAESYKKTGWIYSLPNDFRYSEMLAELYKDFSEDLLKQKLK
jgi:hypothetical protein